MAITLGTFTKQDDNSFIGTLKTLNVTANLSIVPVAKASDNAPDHRVYAGAGQRPPARQGRAGLSNDQAPLAPEVGAGWSQVAKSSGETYLNLKIGAPEFGPPGRVPRPC